MKSGGFPYSKSDRLLDHLTGNTALILAPRRAALLAGFDNQLDVLIRIQAPDAPVDVTKVRPAYAIALVIDRSGSMAGHPLQEAKRCAAFVVDRLRADDTIALVQFDNRVKILCSSKLKVDGCELKRAIDSIEQGGNTNLHGGWRAGVGSLVDTLSATGLRRVIPALWSTHPQRLAVGSAKMHLFSTNRSIFHGREPRGDGPGNQACRDGRADRAAQEGNGATGS
ncbi:MAG: VWA domain-containing protein [Candidatus Accumulibacter sp.]|uniref:vWA domain-containing protein n=1 Tax=Accumulibacter sp. TaxID=2053492 RepID=UPI002587FE87|nr:VWA domain-containing protein [Accumulibacter sp.]MBK8115151.1 VWA domain-containing protein [Accumulibacter sp.]